MSGLPERLAREITGGLTYGWTREEVRTRLKDALRVALDEAANVARSKCVLGDGCSCEAQEAAAAIEALK